MQNPLTYQMSEYDCGSTAVLDGEEVWLEPGCKLYQRLQSGGVEKIDDHPLAYNRKVSLDRMQQHKRRAYALHNLDTRELFLIYNTSDDAHYHNTPQNYLIEEDEDDME